MSNAPPSVPADDPALDWSLQHLSADPRIAAILWSPRASLLGPGVILILRTGDGATTLVLQQQIQQAPGVISVSLLSATSLASMHASGQVGQWRLCPAAELEHMEVLRSSILVHGGDRELKRRLKKLQQLKRGDTSAGLSRRDASIWMHAAAAAAALARYQVAVARDLIDQVQTDLWAWIDVREMEKAMRAKQFPDLPDPPARTDSLADLGDSLQAWLKFYRELRDPVAQRENIVLNRKLQRTAEQSIRRDLLQLSQDLDGS